MKALHEKVNIVPLIAKADCLIPSEIRKLKERVRRSFCAGYPCCGSRAGLGRRGGGCVGGACLYPDTYTHAQRTCTSSRSGALLWELVSAERPALEETPNSFGVCRL